MQNFAKSPKCYSCGAPTNGIFNTAKNLLQKLEEKKKRMPEKGETSKEENNKNSDNDDDDDDKESTD